MEFNPFDIHSEKPVDFAAGQVILVDKPLGWTSFDVVNKIRFAVKHTGQKEGKIKVGHAGTLDPLATGLLIIATGKATRQLDSFQGMDKIYSGHLKLGQSTPSYDGETEPGEKTDTSHIDIEMVREQTKKLTGNLEQIPPIYSAIKVDGRRSYRSARQGQVTELQARSVRVDQFEILSLQDDLVSFRVACSKGTYIRSLAHDLGQALGVGAWLTDLRREAIGPYQVENAFSLESLIDLIRPLAPSGIPDSDAQENRSEKGSDNKDEHKVNDLKDSP